MEPVSEGYDVFIAHAPHDKEYARALHRAIIDLGARAFLDEESVPAGALWSEAIPSALRASKIAAVLIGPNARPTHYLKDEIAEAIDLARRGELRLVPVHLAENLGRTGTYPYGLRVFQFLDYYKLGPEGVARNLLGVGTPARGSVRSPPPRSERRSALTWLHLCSLEFGPDDAADPVENDAVLEALLDDARDLAERLGSPDLILATGEITWSGDDEQCRRVERWLGRLRLAVGAAHDALYLAPGDRDVACSKVTGSAEGDHDVFEGRPRRLHESPGGDRPHMLSGCLAAHGAPIEEHASAFERATAPWWWRSIDGGALGPIRIVGLNSVIRSGDELDPEQPALARRQMDETLRSVGPEGPLVLVLLRRPPTSLEDGDALLRRLRTLPALVLSGRSPPAPSGAPAPAWAGGPVHLEAGSPGDRGPRAYTWGRLDPDGLRLYPRRYATDATVFVADRRPGRLAADGALTREAGALPEPLGRWLAGRRKGIEPARRARSTGEPSSPLELADPYVRTSLKSTLFQAFQLDRKYQWDGLLRAHDYRYAIRFCYGHPRQSLPLLVDRMRQDLERHVLRRATQFIEVPYYLGSNDPGPASADEWLRRIANATDRDGADAVTAILDVGREQETLLILGPIPERRLPADREEAMRDLLARALPEVLARHARERTRGFRVVVLIADALPIEAEPGQESALVNTLGRAAREGFARLIAEAKLKAPTATPSWVECWPRAKFPEWEDVEEALNRASATADQRVAALDAYREFLRLPKRHFAEFARKLELLLDPLFE